MKRVAVLSLLCVVALAGCPKGGDRHVDVGDFNGGGEETVSGCADDAREPDDEVAYVLAKISKDGEKFEAMSCPGDDDFIHLFAEGKASALLTWNASEGGVRVDLLDRGGALVRLDGARDLAESSDGRVFVQRLGVSGDYYLRVRNRAGTPVKYRVEIGASASDGPPPPAAIVTQTPDPTP